VIPSGSACGPRLQTGKTCRTRWHRGQGADPSWKSTAHGDNDPGPLATPAYRGHVQVIKDLIAAGTNLLHVTQHDSTVLIGAAYDEGRAGKTQNIADRTEIVPLILAAIAGKPGAVAAINQVHTSGETALDFASYGNSPDMAAALIAAGAVRNQS
jgi:hypothetical protein